jgi:hypothetical protein
MAAEPSAPRVRRALLAALGAGLAMFLFLQPGNPYDEAEHLHAAWLIAVRHLHPIRDFFEHHPPLFWHVLGVPFRLGIEGPEALYTARALVIGCAAIWSWALFALARRWSEATAKEQPGALAFLLFGLTILFAQHLFVVRPETLASALLALSLLCWTGRSRSLEAAVAAGGLLALCCAASPRFALLAPVFLLAGPDGGFALSRARLAALACGAVAAAAAFLAFLCPWRELLFDLRFSALLQHVGIPPSSSTVLYLASSLAAGAMICGLCFATSRVPARAAAAWGAHGALVWAACLVSAGLYPYTQAFAPGLMWTTLFAAWLEAQPAAEGAGAARPVALAAATIGALAALLVQTTAASLNTFNAPALTAGRRMLLDALPAGSRVLLLPMEHPITIDDASYWGSLLPEDSPGKMCLAVEAYREAYPASAIRLPTCDFVGDLRRARPAAVSRLLFLASPPLQMQAVQAEIAAHYAVSDVLDDAATRAFSVNTLFRRP